MAGKPGSKLIRRIVLPYRKVVPFKESLPSTASENAEAKEQLRLKKRRPVENASLKEEKAQGQDGTPRVRLYASSSRNGTRTLHFGTAEAAPPDAVNALVDIRDGTFYEQTDTTVASSRASSSSRPVAANLSIKIPQIKTGHVPQLAIMAPNPTSVLDIIRGKYVSSDPKARTYPSLALDPDPKMRLVSNAIQYVGFNSATGPGVRGAYLSARFESRREVTDWTLEQYLRGQTELNASSESIEPIDESLLASLIAKLRLEKLMSMPVSNLSNGQTRRSRIAKALLKKPRILLLDEPFMGLDPPSTVSLSLMLKEFSEKGDPLIVLGLKPQDPVPNWIRRLAILNSDNKVITSGILMKSIFDVLYWSNALKSDRWVDNMLEDDTQKITRKTLRDANTCAAEHLVTTLGPPPFETVSVLKDDGIYSFTGDDLEYLLTHTFGKSPANFDLPTLRPGPRREIHAAHPRGDSENKFDGYTSLNIPLDTRAYTRLRGYKRSLGNPSSHYKIPTASSGLQSLAKIDTPVDEPALSQDNCTTTTPSHETTPLIELNSIIVKYGDKVVLGHNPPQPGFTEPGLNLTISKGSRLLLLGPNGSGKTTLLSLLTSDHPKSYSLPIKFFGRTRLPEPGTPGLSLWEIQSRIGYSSPEVHAFFPKNQTVRQVLESAWAETFSSKPQLTPDRNAMVDHFLDVWAKELCQTQIDAENWATDRLNHPLFGKLPFATQRLLLFLRAIIKQPDIVVLDEAFSGLPTETRNKALAWLEHGDQSQSFPGLTDQQALIVVSHVREEIPDCINEYIRLPSEEEASDGKTIMTGKSEHGYIKSVGGWNRLWNI